MAIDKKLIHFGKLADFETQLTAGNILDRSIVFIQDAKKIWTHGTYYDCSEGGATGDEIWYVDDTNGKLITDFDTEVLAELQAIRVRTNSISAYNGNEYTTGEQGQVLTADGNGNMQWSDLPENVYITDFTVQNLLDLHGGYIEELHINGQALMNAIYDRKNIFVRYEGDTVGGYDILLGEVSDSEMYFSVYSHFGFVFFCEAVEDIITSIHFGDLTGEKVERTQTGDLTHIAVANALQTADGYTYAVPDSATGDEDDVLLSRSTVKTINGESILGEGDITIEGGESSQPMVSTTWEELKEMRDSASLVAGTWYRITDYVTTTSQSGTRSLEHPFDVVVLATGADTLSEEARAARHEGDISISVSLMGMNFFYKGVLTVDGVEWFEFENPEAGSIVSSSATPAIGDIVYPYFDGMVATEEAYPIESVSESENEYFLNNNANLDAWKIWYCLDNDKVRFPWAVAKTKKSIVVQMDEAALLTAEYNGTYEYEGVMYYRWVVFFSGMNVLFLTVSDNPKAGDTTSFYGVIEMDMFLPYPMPIVSVNDPSENEGFGVIYRMIDEQNNDIPYDFKNIQFVRKVTLGKLDLENGTDEFVFTFNSFDKNIGRSSDLSFNISLCGHNTIKSSLTGLNDIVFLSESTSIVSCNSNTFGHNCYSNTFGYGCYSNTFGYGCYSNTFGDNCSSNTFGDGCYSNTFGYGCYSNTFGDNCDSNTFGDSCDYITFGDTCYSNTFGYGCSSNTFGNYCYSNTFGDNCSSNTFGDNCDYITFGESADALVSYVMYYTLANSVKNKFLSVEGNRSYETKVAYNSIGELKMYCEADLAD